jgi:hypothetical protein
MYDLYNQAFNNFQGVHSLKNRNTCKFAPGNFITNSIPSPDLFLISNKAGLVSWFIFAKQQVHKLLLLSTLLVLLQVINMPI